MKIRNYQGYTVEYNPELKRFESHATDGELSLTANSETELANKIDAAIKRSEKAKKSGAFPINAIFRFWDVLYVGKITSVADDGGIWISYTKDGENKRAKRDTHFSSFDYFKPTDANLAIVKAHADRETTIGKLRNEMSAIRQSLKDPIEIGDLIHKLNE